MENLLEKLAGGDRRSVGRVDEVVAEVLANPSRFDEVFQGMLGGDPVLRMRSADAVEKITAVRPEMLKPFKHRLIGEVAGIEQQEVRWHLAQLFSRLDLDPAERRAVFVVLMGFLDDRSRIVRTFSMQALADLAKNDADLQGQVVPLLETLTSTGSPAMRSRGKKLLATLRRDT